MAFHLLLALILEWFSPSPGVAPLRPYRLRGYAQGTTYSITYYAPDSAVTTADVDEQLAEIEHSLSLYEPGSLINQFNASPVGLVADPHLKRVVAQALQVYQETDGLFDATVEPLVAAWGFGVRRSLSEPTPAAIQAILKSVGSDKLRLRGDSLVKTTPALRLDLNDIAQGYTVDVLAALLERRRVRNYLVELGGEIRVRGRKWPGGELMRIGIERPDTNALRAPVMQQVLRLAAGGVTTSGNYRQFHQTGRRRNAHLINPKTGYPFQNELISVTVVAPDALTADAYDNALMGMGVARALAFLRQRADLHAYLIYQRPDGTTAATATPGFQQLLLQP